MRVRRLTQAHSYPLTASATHCSKRVHEVLVQDRRRTAEAKEDVEMDIYLWMRKGGEMDRETD
jgi:hypothetical protein